MLHTSANLRFLASRWLFSYADGSWLDYQKTLEDIAIDAISTQTVNEAAKALAIRIVEVRQEPS